jgi:hypothetical protein
MCNLGLLPDTQKLFPSRPAGAVKSIIMTSPHFDRSPSDAEICASVKRLGYGVSQRIRLYGEDFDVISDPFPEAGGIAVSVKGRKGRGIRVVQLPATVLQSVKGPNAA